LEATCPRCNGRVFHSSNRRTRLDGVLRALGFPPRRCAGCGWRGYRPRHWFGARHISSPELEALPAPRPLDPATAAQLAKARATERKAHWRRTLQAIVLATAAGVAAGIAAHACATAEPPSEEAGP